LIEKDKLRFQPKEYHENAVWHNLMSRGRALNNNHILVFKRAHTLSYGVRNKLFYGILGQYSVTLFRFSSTQNIVFGIISNRFLSNNKAKTIGWLADNINEGDLTLLIEYYAARS
jgi:hypothetical protein